MTPVFVDSSAVIRAVLERGMSPPVDRTLASASALIVSRLALVETSRALLRARLDGRMTVRALAIAQSQVDELWDRCEIWELSRAVCEEARRIAPTLPLRSLDALHLATFMVARRRISSLRLLSTDARMLAAATHLGLRGPKI
jgi:predicted nucleic acid-binding protein